MLPALHVGIGPSVPADGIEFLSGRDDGGHWLYAAGDMLVAKVVDRPVTLLLTSVRATGAQPLDVEIDRLDARSAPHVAGEAVAQHEPEPQSERPDESELFKKYPAFSANHHAKTGNQPFGFNPRGRTAHANSDRVYICHVTALFLCRHTRSGSNARGRRSNVAAAPGFD